MGRRSDSKTRILAAAQQLIELRGYSQIGVAEICASAGVPKGSFYYFFASKDALALAVIDTQWESQKADWARILDGEDPLRRLCEMIVSTLNSEQVTGCLYGNLALELSNERTEAIRDRLREIFDAQVDLIAQVTGPDTARAVVAQIEGQIMFAKLHNDIRRLDALWPSIRVLSGEQQTVGVVDRHPPAVARR
ncbi:TetR/AcrR family transcriptional regulator [Actinoplanes sp. NPDC026670]|uniref:TetR/AcrR family transcriptional regulator n=1 Tax=Actinoplanes sp. NPDC026670 TaxID=3154700 RepID=UPI0033C14E53